MLIIDKLYEVCDCRTCYDGTHHTGGLALTTTKLDSAVYTANALMLKISTTQRPSVEMSNTVRIWKKEGSGLSKLLARWQRIYNISDDVWLGPELSSVQDSGLRSC